MPRNRASQLLQAAALAALCVAGPASMATAAGGGFSDLLLDQPRCCPPDMNGERIAQGVGGPVAGKRPGGRAVMPDRARDKAQGVDRPAPPAARDLARAAATTVTPQGSGGVARGARSGMAPVPPGRGAAEPAQGAPRGPAGPVLVQSSEAPPAKPAREEPPATELPPDAERMPETPVTEEGEAFRGSPKPAGPDLTVSEERDLISRGWE